MDCTQVVEACAYRDAPKYLIRDRDRVYGAAVCERLQALGIQEVLTAPASPWQNAYAERLIGSIRRECLNDFVILNAHHLKRTLASYFDYYQHARTHLALAKNCPIPRIVSIRGKITRIPYLGRITSLLLTSSSMILSADAIMSNDNQTGGVS